MKQTNIRGEVNKKTCKTSHFKVSALSNECRTKVLSATAYNDAYQFIVRPLIISFNSARIQRHPESVTKALDSIILKIGVSDYLIS